MMKNIALAVLTAFLAAAGYVGYHWNAMESWMVTPLDANGSAQTVVIPQGSSVRGALRVLAAKKLIEDSPYIRFVGRVGDPLPRIQSGEFEFSPAQSPLEMLKDMAKGKVKLYRFTIPPGQTAVEIARLLEYLGYGKEKNYVRLMNTESVRIAMGVPYFEGYLFPDTYSIPKGYDERKILELMVKEFRKNFTPAMEEKAKALGLTAEQALIAASIIEKEAGGPEEFPLVSSVIQNRLQKGMRLQMDPTVIYGVKKTFSGNLTREHLQTDHDWNTYTRSGLPKTPICSPSIGALKAAVEPAETDYLYFVAMNNGHHKFTATLKEHNAAVHKYQILRHIGP